MLNEIDMSECENIWLSTKLNKKLLNIFNSNKNLKKLYLDITEAECESLTISSPTLKTIIFYTSEGIKLKNFDFNGCTNLEICEIGAQTQISNINGISELKNLRYVGFGRNSSDSIRESVYSFEEREESILNYTNKLPNSSPLNTFINDITSLENMENLEILDISALNRVTAEDLFNVVQKIPNLKVIKGFEINNAIMYSDELVNYCNKHGIQQPFTQRSKDIKDEVKRIISDITTPEMNEEQKVKAITTFVINHMEYNMEAYENLLNGKELDSDTYKKTWQEKLYYSLFEGLGVCDGYEALIHILLQEANINSYREEGLMHTWELVEIDGEYYQLDPTKLDYYLSENNLDIEKVGLGDPFYLNKEGDEQYQEEYIRPKESELKKSIIRKFLEELGILCKAYSDITLNDLLTINYDYSLLTSEDLKKAESTISELMSSISINIERGN